MTMIQQLFEWIDTVPTTHIIIAGLAVFVVTHIVEIWVNKGGTRK